MTTRGKAVETADPLVDGIRAIRQALSDRFGDDWEAYGAYVRKVGAQFRARQAQGVKRRRRVRGKKAS